MKRNRWTCTIVQNTETGKYRIADFRINGIVVWELQLLSEVYYLALKEEVKRVTGIQLLPRRDMFFEKLSDFEKIATIDNTQVRNDCRVTIKERIAGWQPCFE